MGEGFDLMAASTLLSLKRYRGVDIQFVAVTIPAERNRTYAVLYVQIYVDFLENADGSICLYPDSEPNKIFPAKLKKHNTLLYNIRLLREADQATEQYPQPGNVPEKDDIQPVHDQLLALAGGFHFH